jgi:hypothetical protein
MESLITYDCRPKLDNVVFIEGLPGVGNVGKIAADFLAYKLEGQRMASILFSDLPAQVMIDSDNHPYAINVELWYVKDVNGKDIIFLLGENQASTPQGQFELCKLVFEKIIPYDPKVVLTLGGFGLGEIVKDPHVLGAVNEQKLKSRLEKIGVEFRPGEPQGGIIGAAAMFVAFANEYEVDAACLMGETSGFLVDHKSAQKVVEVLCRFLGIEIDTSEMQENIEQIDQINDEVQALADSKPEDLSYYR